MDEKYFAQKIERKWQKRWAENKTFEAAQKVFVVSQSVSAGVKAEFCAKMLPAKAQNTQRKAKDLTRRFRLAICNSQSTFRIFQTVRCAFWRRTFSHSITCRARLFS